MFESSTPIVKTKTSGKAHKSHKASSGHRRSVKIHRAIRKLTMKIARWERNKAEGKKSTIKRVGSTSKKPRRIGGKVANRNNWNTAGLQAHLEVLNASLKAV